MADQVHLRNTRCTTLLTAAATAGAYAGSAAITYPTSSSRLLHAARVKHAASAHILGRKQQEVLLSRSIWTGFER